MIRGSFFIFITVFFTSHIDGRKKQVLHRIKSSKRKDERSGDLPKGII
jgi:hypothetical protein